MTAIWTFITTEWAALKGWRTLSVTMFAGGFAALIGAVEIMDWAPIITDYLPQVPGWAVTLIAAFIGGALRAITTTPMGEK